MLRVTVAVACLAQTGHCRRARTFNAAELTHASRQTSARQKDVAGEDSVFSGKAIDLNSVSALLLACHPRSIFSSASLTPASLRYHHISTMNDGPYSEHPKEDDKDEEGIDGAILDSLFQSPLWSETKETRQDMNSQAISETRKDMNSPRMALGHTKSRRDGMGRSLAAGAIGGSAGLLGGALGLGGGFLAVPALTSLLALDPKLSIGTSSLVNVMVSCASCRSYLTRGLASPRAAGIIALSAIILARLGATVTSKVNSKRLKKVFGSYLVVASLLVAAKASGFLVSAGTTSASAAQAPFLGLTCLGSATGFLSGLLGVGGGTILVPALTLGFGMPQLQAQGCSLLGMIPSSMVSSFTHLQKGNVDKSLVGYVAFGALLGALAGSNLATVLPLNVLRVIFSVVLGSIGLKYATS